MLPLTFQFLIAMVAHAINERMARRIDYLQEEVRVLKEALATTTGKTRIAFTDEQRRLLSSRRCLNRHGAVAPASSAPEARD
jgi:hypothetical protein